MREKILKKADKLFMRPGFEGLMDVDNAELMEAYIEQYIRFIDEYHPLVTQDYPSTRDFCIKTLVIGASNYLDGEKLEEVLSLIDNCQYPNYNKLKV